MPTYDYECSHCGRVFEVFQNMSDDPIEACDHCGGSVRRLIGGGLGIIFKGSGFYVTDNKSGVKAGSRQTAVKEKTSDNSGETGAVKESSSSASQGSGGAGESGKAAAVSGEKAGGTAVKPGKT
jgi:putative FmdB family regulatory protein